PVALYLEHFGLDEPPFRITPHTEFFFDGAERGATLEALAYAVLHDEGIVKLSGEVGSGKTMLCRMLMERLPSEVETIYLATPSLRQLRDRITHSFRMRPLAAAEVAKYLAFRMRAAGYRGPDVFAPRAANRIARASGGLTRRINILADKSLLAAYSEGAHAVTERHARAAIADSEFAAAAARRAWQPLRLAAAGLGVGLILGARAARFGTG